MIVEIKKYYSDVDAYFQFYTREDAEKFERTYKPFYDLNSEAEDMYDRIRVDGDSMLNPQEIGKELFDRAKALLVEYVDNDVKSGKSWIVEGVAEELRAIEFNKKDLYYMTSTFSGDEDYEPEWKIIGYLFDMIYSFLAMK